MWLSKFRKYLKGLVLAYDLVMFHIVGFAGVLVTDLGTVLGQNVADAAEGQSLAAFVFHHQIVLAGVRLFLLFIYAVIETGNHLGSLGHLIQTVKRIDPHGSGGFLRFFLQAIVRQGGGKGIAKQPA